MVDVARRHAADRSQKAVARESESHQLRVKARLVEFLSEVI